MNSAMSMGNFVVFVITFLVLGKYSESNAATVSLTNSYMDLKGNTHIKFYEPREKVWAGLSKGHRFPVLYSGNLIALKLAYTSGSLQTRWIRCASSSYCDTSTCPGGTVMPSNKWSTCTRESFYIRGVNKYDGQPIHSGDYVTLAPRYRGSTCRLRCFSSSSTKCNSATCVSESYFKGNNAFLYSYLTFQIFSRNAVDGTGAIQYGDTVAFRYPYYTGSYWLYYSGGYFYARSVSYNGKTSCARQNYPTGFELFKPL